MHSRITCLFRLAGLLPAALTVLANAVPAQIFHAAEMNTAQYKNLDRGKTAVILTTGILEEHGPYLPAYTDGYISEALVRDVSAAVAAKGWNVLIFPVIPLGAGGANELGAKYPFPGSFTIRVNTLRAVFMDLADELAEAGFKLIFIANNHGAPNHNRALDQVCQYFRETHGGRMIVLRGIRTPAFAEINTKLAGLLSETAKKEDAWSGHAGIGETSLILHLHPHLIGPGLAEAPVQTAAGFGDMIRVAKNPGWTGYFGAPRYSTKEYGVLLYRLWSDQAVAQAMMALEGAAAVVPGFAGNMVSPPDAAALERDAALEKRQLDWLQKQTVRKPE